MVVVVVVVVVVMVVVMAVVVGILVVFSSGNSSNSVNIFFCKPLQELFSDSGMIVIAVGIIGATVMPHNLFLHSSIILTRKVCMNHYIHLDTLVHRVVSIHVHFILCVGRSR